MTLTHEKDDEIIAMLEEKWNTDYGNMKWSKKGLELATGGWSDNEAIIHRLMNSMFWMKYWKETKRGGYYLFDYHKEICPICKKDKIATNRDGTCVDCSH